MLKPLSALFICTLMISQASAQERAFNILNMSGVTITSVSAQVKGGTAAPLQIFTGSLAHGDQASVNILIADDACVFDFTISFEGAITNKRNDIDVCQTDAIAVE